MGRKKISIVGAGNVGATIAHITAMKELGDVALVDIVEGLPQGKALDLSEGKPVDGYDVNIIGANDYESTADSDIVVITAGLPRKPGMSRDDLQEINADIISVVTEQVADFSPNAIVIIVTNPLDVMCYLAKKVSGFPKSRVVGQAGALDSSRMRFFIAEELDVSVEDVTTFVLGGHGDTMVPLVRYTYVGGIPVSQILSEEKLDAIVTRTKKAGGEIVGLLKTGSAYFSTAAATVQMVESIVKDKKRIIPCSAYLEGEFGFEDIYLGVPVVLGENGIEKVLEIELTPDEAEALDKSANAVRCSIKKLTL